MDNEIEFKRTCYFCTQDILVGDATYNWQTREYCSFKCLNSNIAGYQDLEVCSSCQGSVSDTKKINLCVRFGSSIKQFCSPACLDLYKTAKPFCKLCQELILGLMLISHEEVFCSLFCVSRYSAKGINQVDFTNESTCCKCSKFGVHHLELLKDCQSLFFCSEQCLHQYKESSTIYICSSCGCLILAPFDHLYKDGDLKTFCSKQCYNIHLVLSAELCQCSMCKVKKLNFDLIQRRIGNQEFRYFCSLPCLMVEVDSESMEEESFSLDSPPLPALRIRTADEVNSLDLKALLEEKDTEQENKISSEIQQSLDRIQRIIKEKFYLETKDACVGTQTQGTSVGTMWDSDATSGFSHQQCQTDRRFDVKAIPVPFPVYIPVPASRFPVFQPSPLVLPLPVAFPVPIPILSSRKQERKAGEVEEDKMEEEVREGGGRKGEGKGFSDESLSPVSVSEIDLDASSPLSAEEDPSVKDEDYSSEDTELKESDGMRLWNAFVRRQQSDEAFVKRLSDRSGVGFAHLGNSDRSLYLSAFASELLRDDRLHPNTVTYVLLCVQKYLAENLVVDSFFLNECFPRFAKVFYPFLQKHVSKFSSFDSFIEFGRQFSGVRIREEMLWDSLQLGSLSPSILIFTVLYLNTKIFKFRQASEHKSVSFKRFVKYMTKKVLADGTPVVSKALRYIHQVGDEPKKVRFEIKENVECPWRCAIKLHEFYASKCPPEALMSGYFYLSPILGCFPDSKVWFSSRRLSQSSMENFLSLILMVEEVQSNFRSSPS